MEADGEGALEDENLLYSNLNVKETDMKAVAADFAQLYAVDASVQVKALEQVVDNLLARLEELCTVTDQIRHESKEVLFVTLPNLFQEANKLREIFNQIDNLEKFINLVKDYVNEMEEQVHLAEKEFGNKQMKKIMSSLPRILLKKQTQGTESNSSKGPLSWNRPPDLKVGDFFVHDSQTSGTLSSDFEGS